MPKALIRLTDQEFYSLMARVEPFEMVIKSAIVIEGEIEEIFNKAFFDPARLTKMELRYEQKVELVLALGLDERFGPPLRSLAKLRNVFAHNLEAKFSKSEADNFYSSFHKKDRKITHDTYERMDRALTTPFDEIEPAELYVLSVISLRAAIKVAQKQTLEIVALRRQSD